MITLSELQLKEVITINNGKRLGHLSDLEIDPHYGNILAIIIYLRDGNAFFWKARGANYLLGTNNYDW